jgi:uncharacterized membrane protein (DUF4010 family)
MGSKGVLRVDCDMAGDIAIFPYWPTLARLMLALGLGLFVGVERERRRKEAGLRTFAFVSLLGAIGGLLGRPFAELALVLLGVLIVLLNIETIRTGEGAEITTSAALLVTGFVGLMAGQGHTFTPTAVGVITAGLLAWKEPLAGFSVALTEAEFRSAVLLGILAFVVYPVLPAGTVDPWHVLEPRSAWITVILIAGLGFMNYVLLKVYGSRGIELTGFLGGLVNSTVTTTELAQRVPESQGFFAEAAYRGIVLAIAAMLARNAVILGALAPRALQASAVPLGLMFAIASSVALLSHRHPNSPDGPNVRQEPLPSLASPFSPISAIKFGLVFLILQVAGNAAQRMLGSTGLFAVSAVGGLVSSASAVAAAANLTALDAVNPQIAGIAAIIASLTSACVSLPVVARVARDRGLVRRVIRVLGGVAVGAVLGLFAQYLLHG